LKAIECGVGYRVEWEDALYLVPDRICRIDEQNRFHSLTGPAIWWKGGHEFYFVNGVLVPEKIVKTPEKLTKRDWVKEKNLEVRRIIQERMSDFVKKIGGKRIDKSLKGELYEIDLKDDPEKIAHYIKVKDASTSRIYYLRVPPTVEKVDEAISWTFNLKTEDYQPIKET
jgi:hypothetical protein